jgi:hypothetical protein
LQDWSFLHLLFPLHPQVERSFQRFSENVVSQLKSPTDRLNYQIKLVDRRANELILLANTPDELIGLQSLDDQLNQLLKAISALDPEQLNNSKQSILELLNRSSFAYSTLQTIPADSVIGVFFSEKLLVFRNIVLTGIFTPEQIINVSVSLSNSISESKRICSHLRSIRLSKLSCQHSPGQSFQNQLRSMSFSVRLDDRFLLTSRRSDYGMFLLPREKPPSRAFSG